MHLYKMVILNKLVVVVVVIYQVALYTITAPQVREAKATTHILHTFTLSNTSIIYFILFIECHSGFHTGFSQNSFPVY